MNTSFYLQALINNYNDDNLEYFLREKSDILEFTSEELSFDKEKFTNYDNAKLLAKSDLPDGTFIVCTLRVTKDLTERSSKKEQYELAKNILKSSYYDAGIFVFYDHNGNFRFSLIYAEYQGNKRTWNNFKRFTYFVSPHQTNKTFIDQIGNADFSTIEALKKAFSVEPVTKQFYDELQNWYFWAMDQVEFPDDEDKDRKNRNAKNLIRMITRIIFIWFMKEKRLIPATLFDKSYIDTLLNYGDATGSTYYKAILQNLFFATLNTPMRKDDPQSRIFIEDAKKFGFVNDGYLQQGYFRYSRFITDKEAFLKEFDNIPFLNGGLFESLDKKVDGREIRIDCFSDNPKNETRLKVPDYLFFSEEQITDLSAYLENGKRKKVRGLITILNSYNFTVEENTPLDKEIALDPELLGKVFENLLASYNPETAVTARKATGSYYTPREIVDYMVKESLIQYFSVLLGNDENNREKLIKLFSYTDNSNPFNNEDDIHKMLIGIEKIKILDPACGSGAFPMSILHSLVLALHKLDPENQKWKNNLLEKVPVELKEEVEKSLKNKSLDYIRKLGLIENCIFGVDIQEIAIQISKLRFFISLLIEQEVDDNKPNRDIRALPNLETKFVAANSLINLEPDPNKANSLIKSPEVEALEEKLFAIREKIFYTNSRNEKLQLEKELTLIREQLKLQLENGSFSNDKADKITSWDPFDQNTHADWFDPEWMFGIKDGFDIVIGNPPYIDSEGMLNFGLEGLRKYISANYSLTKGNWDIYVAFFEQGFKLLNATGILTYITPDKWISKPFGDELRKNTINNIYSILKAGREIFEGSKIDAIVSFFIKNNVEKLKIFDFKDNKIIFKREVNKKVLKSPFAFDFLFSNYLELLIKIETMPNKKLDSFNCENACATSDAYKLEPLIIDLLKNKFDRNDHLKVINTGTISKYVSKWGIKEMTYLGNKYLCPVVNKREFLKLFNNSYAKKSVQSKIIIKGLNLLDACLDLDGSIIPGKTTLIIANTDINELKFLSAILNSKLTFFYIKEKYPASSYNKGINFTPNMINNLPVPQTSKTDQKPFIELVDKILSITKDDDYFNNPTKQAQVKEYERQIDQMVYKLYGLTDEEIKIVEG